MLSGVVFGYNQIRKHITVHKFLQVKSILKYRKNSIFRCLIEIQSHRLRSLIDYTYV